LNPIMYITEGFRDAMLEHVWFYDKPEQTLIFWGLTFVTALIGITVFKKLRPWFADYI